MRSISFLTILIIALSCTPIIKTVYGIRQPQLESKKSINEFLLSKNIDSTRNFVFKDLSSFATASQRGILSIPDAVFYNSKGHKVDYNKSAANCNAAVDDFILDLNSFNTMTGDSLQTSTNLTRLLKGTAYEKSSSPGISVYITWTMYSGKLNDEKAFEWIKLLEKAQSTGLNVEYYLVNCDYQKDWNIPLDLQKKLRIKAARSN